MKSDLVPCYYTGQNYRFEQPADFRLRSEVHQYKAQKLGKFIASGRIFLFSARRTVKVIGTLWDGPAGAKTVLTFLKATSYGDKLHYEIPHAGDRGTFARHRRRNYFSSRICKDDNCECGGCRIPA